MMLSGTESHPQSAKPVWGCASSHGDEPALTHPRSWLLSSGLAAPWVKGSESRLWQSHGAKLAGRRGWHWDSGCYPFSTGGPSSPSPLTSVTAWMDAPCFRRSSMTLIRFFLQAMWRGVKPFCKGQRHISTWLHPIEIPFHWVWYNIFATVCFWKDLEKSSNDMALGRTQILFWKYSSLAGLRSPRCSGHCEIFFWSPSLGAKAGWSLYSFRWLHFGMHSFK